MIRKQGITILLFLVSIIMLAMPVIPHHHHQNQGSICLKNDITEEQQCPVHHADDEACCNSLCLARIDSSTPILETHNVQPHYSFVVTRFTDYLIEALLYPLERSSSGDTIYLERLHGANIFRAFGLRAPPCVVA